MKRKVNRKNEILNLLREMPHTALMLAVRLNVTTGAIYPYIKELWREGMIIDDTERWCLVSEYKAKFFKASQRAGGCRHVRKFDFNGTGGRGYGK